MNINAGACIIDRRRSVCLSSHCLAPFFTTRGGRPGMSGGSTSSSSAMPPAAEPSLRSATSTPLSEGVSTADTPGPKNDSNLVRRVYSGAGIRG